MDDVIYMDKPNGTEKKYQKYRSKKPVYLGENFYHPEKLVTRIVFADPSLEKGWLSGRQWKTSSAVWWM